MTLTVTFLTILSSLIQIIWFCYILRFARIRDVFFSRVFGNYRKDDEGLGFGGQFI